MHGDRAAASRRWRSGQRVGTVKVALDGKPIGEFPLVALDDVPPASFFGRAWDTVRLWFK